ncbi:hypothetical protein SVA_1233 [Sulfurifustis variabilis]|uniref:EF-hand domain-containing protein n=1 Tax=Sulfurifustis variabilis TaxID=1675686 RepID=A0A1B4V2N7_9GAMM|nr:EF-hand domain-containing protein [Sulfurifustis variabilis]BAU47808.1 hypothetical protein SVA_1233 [Sulfurifustis variabilis]
MKHHRIFFLLPLFALSTLYGCATLLGKEDQQQSAVQSFEATQKQMADLRAQVERTMFSLDSVMSAPPGQIRTAYTPYSDNVDQLSAMAQQLSENAQNMREQRINYMTEWQRTRLNVEDPKLRQVADRRHEEVSQQLANIETTFKKSDQGIKPLVSHLQDIQRVIGSDPTPANVAAVQKSGVVRSAKQEASRLNSNLTVAINQFDRVLGRLAPEPGVPPVKAAKRPAPAGAAATAAIPSFTQADRDQSGAIEQGEAGAIQGLDFSSADRDGDGRLSQSEYEAATKARGDQGSTPGSAEQNERK